MKPEQSQNASMVLSREKLMLASICWCQASVITVKRQVKAAAKASASQRPGLPGVHEEHCYKVSGNVLMAAVTPRTHGLIKQLLP